MAQSYTSRYYEIVVDDAKIEYRIIGPTPTTGPRSLLAKSFKTAREARKYAEEADAVISAHSLGIVLPAEQRDPNDP